MKLNRNTKPATLASSQNAKKRRFEVAEQIRKRVFKEFCKCGRCRHGNYAKLCISNTELAAALNALKVASPRGKVGRWQATTVKNLFTKLKQDSPPKRGMAILIS